FSANGTASKPPPSSVDTTSRCTTGQWDSYRILTTLMTFKHGVTAARECLTKSRTEPKSFASTTTSRLYVSLAMTNSDHHILAKWAETENDSRKRTKPTPNSARLSSRDVSRHAQYRRRIRRNLPRRLRAARHTGNLRATL